MERHRASRPSRGQHTVVATTVDRFSIRRTRSELGYTYWVLQGHGKYNGFTLFDTWQEAIDEAQRRISRSSYLVESLVAVSVGA